MFVRSAKFAMNEKSPLIKHHKSEIEWGNTYVYISTSPYFHTAVTPPLFISEKKRDNSASSASFVRLAVHV